MWPSPSTSASSISSCTSSIDTRSPRWFITWRSSSADIRLLLSRSNTLNPSRRSSSEYCSFVGLLQKSRNCPRLTLLPFVPALLPTFGPLPASATISASSCQVGAIPADLMTVPSSSVGMKPSPSRSQNRKTSLNYSALFPKSLKFNITALPHRQAFIRFCSFSLGQLFIIMLLPLLIRSRIPPTLYSRPPRAFYLLNFYFWLCFPLPFEPGYAATLGVICLLLPLLSLLLGRLLFLLLTSRGQSLLLDFWPRLPLLSLLLLNSSRLQACVTLKERSFSQEGLTSQDSLSTTICLKRSNCAARSSVSLQEESDSTVGKTQFLLARDSRNRISIYSSQSRSYSSWWQAFIQMRFSYHVGQGARLSIIFWRKPSKLNPMEQTDGTAVVEGLKTLITQIFGIFDSNKDSKLDSYEFGNLLMHLSEIVTKSKVKASKVDEVMKLCDEDSDGFISKEEYLLFRDIIIAEIQQKVQKRPKEAKRLMYQLHSFIHSI